jgi:hypothetical protein
MADTDARLTALEARVAELEAKLAPKPKKTTTRRPARVSPAPVLHPWPEFEGLEMGIRVFNVLTHNGVENGDQLLALDATVTEKWQNGGRIFAAQVASAQDRLRAQRAAQNRKP